MKDHKDQITPDVKELYHSVHAPEELREKTLAAIKDSPAEKGRATILRANFKAIGTVAACFVLCLGLVLSGVLRSDMNVSAGGNPISSDTVVCNLSDIHYIPEAMPISAKSSECTVQGKAIRLDVDFDGKYTANSSAGRLCAENSDGKLLEISQNTEIRGNSALYVLTDGEAELTVTLTSHNGNKSQTLLILENSDGTFSVGIK